MCNIICTADFGGVVVEGARQQVAQRAWVDHKDEERVSEEERVAATKLASGAEERVEKEDDSVCHAF